MVFEVPENTDLGITYLEFFLIGIIFYLLDKEINSLKLPLCNNDSL
jgi:hypothetical protein